MSATHECPRCNGKGRLDCFGHVVGGVCFRCGGSGRVAGKAHTKLPLFAVSLVERATGDFVRIYNLRAKDAEQALKKARATYTKGSDSFRAEFDIDSAKAELA